LLLANGGFGTFSAETCRSASDPEADDAAIETLKQTM